LALADLGRAEDALSDLGIYLANASDALDVDSISSRVEELRRIGS
jgi:hypothetical protein